MTPYEITRDEFNDIASFEFYKGRAYVEKHNLIQGNDLSEVRQGTHFIICCGDFMVKVEESDFPEIKRRLI